MLYDILIFMTAVHDLIMKKRVTILLPIAVCS